jgi:hypothetical protein
LNDRYCKIEEWRREVSAPVATALISGLVSPNIQANETAMIPINIQNKSSNFLTPKFSRKRNKNLDIFKQETVFSLSHDY